MGTEETAPPSGCQPLNVPPVIPLAPRMFMQVTGGIEILAGLIVAFKPRIGSYIVALWLWAIIANLLILGSYLDIALRDFAISLGALALAQIALAVHRSRAR